MHGRLESTEWHILTGPPDCTVVIDERSPLEVKLRVLPRLRTLFLVLKLSFYALFLPLKQELLIVILIS